MWVERVEVSGFVGIGVQACARQPSARAPAMLSVHLGSDLARNAICGILMLVSPKDKPLVILSGEIKTPPLSSGARIEAGYLLRRLQKGEALWMPHSRPMPVIGPRCHELRIQDAETGSTWRIIYRADAGEILVVDVFAKKTQATPKQAIAQCKQRLRDWDRDD